MSRLWNGEISELRKMADTLDRIKDSFQDIEQNLSHGSLEAIGEWVNNENWMTASEAVKRGLAMMNEMAVTAYNSNRPSSIHAAANRGDKPSKCAPGHSNVIVARTESQRIQDLESIRTPMNSHVIDRAIKNGTRPEDAALEIVKAGLHRTEEEIENELVATIVAEANKIMAARQGNTNQTNSPSGDPDVDAIVEEIHRLQSNNSSF